MKLARKKAKTSTRKGLHEDELNQIVMVGFLVVCMWQLLFQWYYLSPVGRKLHNVKTQRGRMDRSFISQVNKKFMKFEV